MSRAGSSAARRLARGATALSLTVLAAVAGLVPAASAAPNLDCAGVYAVQGADDRNLWAVGLTDGSLTPVGSFQAAGSGTAVNGLAITENGTRAYTVQSDGDGGTSIYLHNRASGSSTRLGSGAATTKITHGAINPANGNYYYGGFDSTTRRLLVYGHDVEANVSLGLVAEGAVPAPSGTNGDWTFDRQGRLYVAVGSATDNYVSVVNQTIPAVAGPPVTITAEEITRITGTTEGINGIAFAGSGYLYLGSTANLYQVNPSSGDVVATRPFASSGSVDLASCASPTTITVQGSFPDGRVSTTDQVTVTVTGGGIESNNTGTTSGTDPGEQTGGSEAAGPVFGLEGEEYTVTATGPGTVEPGYTTAWECVDENDGTSLAAGTGTSGTFTMPGKGAAGVAASCTFTTAAQIPGVTLDTQVEEKTGDTAGSTVTFRYEVLNSGTTPVTVTVADPVAGPVTCPTEPVAPDATVTCTAAPYTLTQADVDAGQIGGRAVATGTPTTEGLPTTTDEDPDTVPITRTSALSVSQDVTVQDVDRNELLESGDTVTASYTVRNTGNTTVSAVGVDSSLGAASCSPTALAPGEEATCTLDTAYDVTAGDDDRGTLTAEVTARGGATTGPVTSTTATMDLTVTEALPALAVSTTAETEDVNGSGLTDAGDRVDYAYTVTNTGNVTVSGIEVTSSRVGTVACEQTVLTPGESTDCVAAEAYRVTDENEEAGSVADEATALGVLPDDTAVQSPTTTTTTPVTAPAPALTLTGDEPSVEDVNGSGITDAGDRVRFGYTVVNSGNVPLEELELVTHAGDDVVCAAATLAVDAETTCYVDHVVTDADEEAGEIAHSARATAVDPDEDEVRSEPVDSTVPVVAPEPALSVQGEAPQVVDVDEGGFTDAGDTVRFRYTVTNTGNVPVSGVLVSGSLAGAVTCEETVLAVAGSTLCVADEPYVVTGSDEVAGDIVDSVHAEGRDPDDGEVASSGATVTVPVQLPRPALDLELRTEHMDTDGDTRVDAGEQVGFLYVVTNTGDRRVSEVTVDSALVDDVSCEPSVLDPGESAECRSASPYLVTGADVDAGGIREAAVATGTARLPGGQDGPVRSPERAASLEADVRTALELSVTGALVDADGDGRADAGERIRYTFTVTNTGTTTVNGIAVDAPRLRDAGVEVVCATDTLAAGESTTCTAEYVVTAADALLEQIDLAATAGGCSVGGCAVASVTSADDTVTIEVDTVVAEPVTPVEPEEPDVWDGGLPNTGGPAGSLVAAGLLSLLGGAGALLVARRRALR